MVWIKLLSDLELLIFVLFWFGFNFDYSFYSFYYLEATHKYCIFFPQYMLH